MPVSSKLISENDNPAEKEISPLDVGIKVLNEEMAGLQSLIKGLDSNFIRAVEAVHDMKNQAGRPGRLIVAGIGKSGHVSRKLAATLSSTGTPSFFVHPGEASHGDLGMVTEADMILLLSNSGENTELSDLIHYTRRHNIMLIAMTSNPSSPLAHHSDIVLLLPDVPEACPNGLAPTTSTTMMIALGDALAVALHEKMGLTKEQYKAFHPGGKLGQRLQKVKEIMCVYDDLPRVDPSANMDQAVIVLAEKNLGCVLVMDDKGDMKGIITDGDLKRHMSPDLLKKPVLEIMSKNPKTIGQEALAAEALNIMTGEPGKYITTLMVTDNKEKVVGMIRLQDCLQAGIA